MSEIVFIDIEATSLEPDGLPIEIAWGSPGGEVTSLLVAPSPALDWDPESIWDEGAEMLHGISLERLEREGVPPDLVADRLAATLQGRQVYSDAPGFDEAWLDRLFDCTMADRSFPIRDFVGLIAERSGMPREAVSERLEDERRLRTGMHRAGNDVRLLLDFHDRAGSG